MTNEMGTGKTAYVRSGASRDMALALPPMTYTRTVEYGVTWRGSTWGSFTDDAQVAHDTLAEAEDHVKALRGYGCHSARVVVRERWTAVGVSEWSDVDSEEGTGE